MSFVRRSIPDVLPYDIYTKGGSIAIMSDCGRRNPAKCTGCRHKCTVFSSIYFANLWCGLSLICISRIDVNALAQYSCPYSACLVCESNWTPSRSYKLVVDNQIRYLFHNLIIHTLSHVVGFYNLFYAYKKVDCNRKKIFNGYSLVHYSIMVPYTPSTDPCWLNMTPCVRHYILYSVTNITYKKLRPRTDL